MPTLALFALLVAPLAQPPAAPVNAPRVERVPLLAAADGGRIVAVAESPATRPGAGLVLGELGTPPRFFRFLRIENGRAQFFRTDVDPTPLAPSARAWLLPADLVAKLVPDWPVAANLTSTIESVGPESASVWIHAGSNAGVRVGDIWWARPGGQPLARFDVRYVEPDICFAGVLPLVQNFELEAGMSVALWPTPGQQRRDTSRSAVSHVESRAGATFIWVPIPPSGEFPPDTRIDIYRDGRYIDHALVERRDPLFWYARVLETRPADSGPFPTTAPATLPASAPAADAPLSRVRIGDDCIIRTRADIEARRFVARVFENSANGWLITAGDLDGLKPGDEGSVYREGTMIGRVRMVRIQNVYSSVALLPETQTELRPGDAVRFTPLPVGRWIGRIDQVWPDGLFNCKLQVSEPPALFEPLAVRADGRTVAVAVLLDSAADAALGIVLPLSLARPLEPGMDLVAEPEN